MKKLFIVTLCLLLYAVPAIAGGGKAIANFGNNAQVDLVIPGKAGHYTCISEIHYNTDTATDDITFYWRDGDRAFTYLTADLAPGVTLASSTTSAVSGIATDAIVVLQRADSSYAEYEVLTTFTDKVPVLTNATTVKFKKGDIMYELAASTMVFNNQATDAVIIENEHGLFCGPLDSPILMIASASSIFEEVFAFWRSPNEERPVGWFDGVAGQSIALPGRSGKRIVVTGWGVDANGATDDLEIYTWTGLDTGSTMITADVSAAATAIVIITDPGFSSTTDFAFLQRADGLYAEITALTSISGTDVVSAALQNDYKKGDILYEAEHLVQFKNMGAADARYSNEHGLFVGPVGKPLGFIMDHGSSILHYVIGYYEDAYQPRQTLAMFSQDVLSTEGTVVGSHLALPGVPGKITCITGLGYDITTAGDDIAFWTAVTPFDTAFLTTAVVADVTVTVHKQPGSDDEIGDTAQMVIQRPDLVYAETFPFTSAVDNDSGVATGGIDNAFPVGSKMFEMETNAIHHTNVTTVTATERTWEKDEGFFCGPRGSPVAVVIAGTDSMVKYLTGFAE